MFKSGSTVMSLAEPSRRPPPRGASIAETRAVRQVKLVWPSLKLIGTLPKPASRFDVRQNAFARGSPTRCSQTLNTFLGVDGLHSVND